MAHDAAVESAILAEIAERTRTMQEQDRVANEVTNLLFAGEEVPEDVPVRKAFKATVKNPDIQIQEMRNPNEGYVELPKAVRDFVSKHTSVDGIDTNSTFRNAKEYFTRFDKLTQESIKYPSSVPSPLGWESSHIKDGRTNVASILRQRHELSRYPEMLTDLIRWACTVQLSITGESVQGTLTKLVERGAESDKRMKESLGSAMLHKFRTIVALMQTDTFKDRPELLVEFLVDDWKNVERAVTYRTPLAELSAHPDLNDSQNMTCVNLTKAGSLQSFAEKLQAELIDSFKVAAQMREHGYESIALGRSMNTAYLRANRQLNDAESPVSFVLGYQEQKAVGASMDKDGITESYEDHDILRVRLDQSGLVIEPLYLSSSAPLSKPAQDAVKVLTQLNELGK